MLAQAPKGQLTDLGMDSKKGCFGVLAHTVKVCVVSSSLYKSPTADTSGRFSAVT